MQASNPGIETMSNVANGKPITQVLNECENGHLVAEITAKVYELIQAAQDTRKSAKLNIKLEFKPTGKGSINVIAAYDVKKPEHDRPGSTFFVGTDGALIRDDPNQPKLPLRSVEHDTDGVIRDIDDRPTNLREVTERA
jgi:hypothetical protein